MALSGHSRAHQVWLQMSAQIAMVIHSSSSYFPEIGDLADRHLRIVEVLRAGNSDDAAGFVSRHIQEGGERLLADISTERENGDEDHTDRLSRR
jgi:DNA-binding GntR family transcriptional regulator